MIKKAKVPENRDQGIGLNGSVKKRIVDVFILKSTKIIVQTRSNTCEQIGFRFGQLPGAAAPIRCPAATKKAP